MLSTDQSIDLNSADAPQPIILEQTQHYGSRTQAQYSVQTVQEDIVTDFPVEIHPQIYYTTPPPPKPPVMQQQASTSPIIAQQISQQMITTNSVVAQTQIASNGQRQMVTQHVSVDKTCKMFIFQYGIMRLIYFKKQISLLILNRNTIFNFRAQH